MSSVREQLVAYAVTALNTGRPTGVPAARRHPGEVDEALTLPSCRLALLREALTPVAGRAGPLRQRSLTVVLHWRFAGAGAVSPDAAADVALNWATSRLDGSTLGGLALDVQESEVGWEFHQGEVPVVRIAQSFEIAYTTRVGDAEQRV